jgi:hypothetical protein
MTHIKIDKKLTDRFHFLGGNVSGFCRRSLKKEIERIEQEIGANLSPNTPTTNPKEGE